MSAVATDVGRPKLFYYARSAFPSGEELGPRTARFPDPIYYAKELHRDTEFALGRRCFGEEAVSSHNKLEAPFEVGKLVDGRQ